MSMNSPLSNYPQPQPSWQVHPAVNATLTVLFFMILAGFAVYAARLWRRGGGPVGLILLIGGAAAFAIEPILDALGMCFHPRNQPVVWDILGRPDPLFCLPIYMFWTGGCALLVWRALENGAARRHLWIFYGAAFVGDVLLETICLKLNAWYYYGNQPLRILDFPWWYASANAGFAVIGGVVLYVLADRLRGWGSLIAVCVPGVSIIVSYAISAWPTWAALNTNLPAAAIWPAGLATVGLGLGGVWFFTIIHQLAARARAVPRDRLVMEEVA
jgi:hypothetical protein